MSERKVNLKFRWEIITALFLLVILPNVVVADIIPEKAPGDESETRRFVMDNGLKVLLVSDPKFNVSAASMSVAIGSLSDSESAMGSTHFLEHMLFLGTEKYPAVDDYSKYLNSNGGWSNAYTARDHTNYYFEVKHDALGGALERFSQFFIAPLFDTKYTERERNAVDSEHGKNLLNDGWRVRQLRRSYYNSPFNKFSTGSHETLEHVSVGQLKEFYSKHYGATQMALVILGKESLDALENYTKEYFGPIENRGLEDIQFDQTYLQRKEALRMLKVLPVKDVKYIEFEFPLQPLIGHYKSKIGSLIGTALGDEGEGSLLAHLKEEGLATGLSAGSSDRTKNNSSFGITVSLTPQGVKEYPRIMRLVFSYIQMMKNEGYQKYLFDEEKVMAKLDFAFSDKGEGGRRASGLSYAVSHYPLEDADKIGFLWEKQDPELYERVLGSLVPSNMFVTLVDRGVSVTDTEPIYGTRYSYEEITGDLYAALLTPPKIVELTLPKPNPFIPKKYKVLADRPIKIIDDSGVVLWYLKDEKFERPKVSMIFKFLPAKEIVNVRHYVLVKFYSAAINEALNKLSYPAHRAGLNYSVSGGLEGINIIVGGYSDAAMGFLGDVIKELKVINIDEERFDAIKDEMVRGLESYPLGRPTSIAREYAREFRLKTYFSPSEQLDPAREITIDELREFAKNIYREGHVQGLVYGNITRDVAELGMSKILQELQSKPIPRDEAFRAAYLVQSEQEDWMMKGNLETNNSCFRRDYFLGSRSDRDRAIGEILELILSQPFYKEMRTDQQLGYIVYSGIFGNPFQLRYTFIIQSEAYGPDELSFRADSFILSMSSIIEELSDTDFENIKSSRITQLEEKHTSVAGVAAGYYSEAFDPLRDFDRVAGEIEEIERLTKGDVLAAFTAMVNPESRKMLEIRLYAKQHENESDAGTTGVEAFALIDDIDVFKSDREFVK